MEVTKFRFIEDEEDVEHIEPLHNHHMDLDHLENVEGFSQKGKKDRIYAYTLNGR